jgi:hypothetical protein
VSGGAGATGDSCAAEDWSSSSEELEEKVAALDGADLRRGVVDLVAGRGGLKAVALRLGADFEDSGMIRQFDMRYDLVRSARHLVAP